MRSDLTVLAVLTGLWLSAGQAAAQDRAVGGGVPPYSPANPAFQRPSSDLQYWACDGMNFLPRYSAKWREDEFVMTRVDGADTRTDPAVNFVDWTMTCWTARWDPKQNAFVVKRLPHEQDEHVSTELHVLAHDLSPWTASRDTNGWVLRPGRFLPPLPVVPYANNPFALPNAAPTAGVPAANLNY